MIKSIFIACLIIFTMKTVQYNITEDEKLVIQSTGLNHLEWMEENGIQCPEVVVAQMCLETKYLTSRIYRENHNGFGMKVSVKDTFQIGEHLGHAKYECVPHSLLAYRDWQRRRFPNRKFKSNEEYIYALGHLFKNKDGSWARYAEDKDYEKKLFYIINLLYNGSNGS